MKLQSDPLAVPRSVNTGWDEGNVARLGLISIQEHIPENFISWETQYLVSGRPVKVSCEAFAWYRGVPHGLDNDVAIALLEFFIEAGSPEGGDLELSVYSLISRAGWDRKGHYYNALESSLWRLRSATYTVQDAWYDKELHQLTSVTFNYLEHLEYLTVVRGSAAQGPFSHKTVVRLRLAAPIVRSVRAGYLKPLSMDFARSLERPLSRAVYRLIDAQRYSLELDTRSNIFDVGLLAWAQTCTLFDSRPERIRRTLSGAHQELLERGYLKEVVYTGRGQQQRLSYTLGEAPVGGEGSKHGDLESVLPRTQQARTLKARKASRDTPQRPLTARLNDALRLVRPLAGKHLEGADLARLYGQLRELGIPPTFQEICDAHGRGEDIFALFNLERLLLEIEQPTHKPGSDG